MPRFSHIIVYSPYDPSTNHNPDRRILSAGQIATALLVLHAIFAVASILVAGKPAKYFNNIPFILIMAFHTDVVNPIATSFTMVACALQASLSQRADFLERVVRILSAGRLWFCRCSLFSLWRFCGRSGSRCLASLAALRTGGSGWRMCGILTSGGRVLIMLSLESGNTLCCTFLPAETLAATIVRWKRAKHC
jgi:hypothetical protein